ncbi:MAG TPA: LUD domain-containing protein, partial [Thermomicrobiales bacterium]|nr:LUD domain-containing protein [Thermomicrobiales bacterium]
MTQSLTQTAADAAIELRRADDDGIDPFAFAQRYQDALAQKRLARNLTRFQQSWKEARGAAFSEAPFATLRGEMKAAKSVVSADLDRFVDRFQAAAERAGATVHRAADGDEANRIIAGIARRHGVTTIAKSKSMVSEEIELNHVLAEVGIAAVETDLGEWIVQQRHERPSHMVMPAVHLSRQEVGAVVSDALGREVARDDIAAQVHAARDAIRAAFFRAGMGVTGANALVAETGSVMMSTNEGNGRLCASVPPVHVVLAGIEKLVPTFEDAMTQLRLLARSGTGQRITTYTTFMTGPTPGHELHIVLLDNGRRAMAARPEFEEALHCIRCAACANVCPPYGEVGGHVFGYIYTGAIGLVVTPFLNGLDADAGPQSLCLSCNACEMVCPVGIPLPRQILDVRQMVVEKNGMPRAKRIALGAYSRPKTADMLATIGRRLQLPVTRGSRFVRVRRAPILRGQTRWRSLPALAERPLRARMAPGRTLEALTPVISNQATGLTVALFPGCMTDRLYPEQGEAIVGVLRRLGVRMTLPAGLHCCGLPAYNSGDARHAKWMARQTIRALERCNADWVLSGSASCTATMLQDYGHLFRDEPAWARRAAALSRRVIDFTSFLDRVAALPDGSLADGPRRTLAYHDSCQGMNALGLRPEPRRILRDVLGHDVRDLRESICCGFGGTFSFQYPEVARRLMDRKLDDAEATGAPMLVTDNQGCIMHLRGGCDVEHRPFEVRHLAELVAERIEAYAARAPHACDEAVAGRSLRPVCPGA